MPVTIIDTLQRGGSGLSPFPVVKEDDSRLSYLTVVDVAARDLIPEWKRLPFMRVHVISDVTDYRLGVDVTIAGQVWTEVAAGGITPGTYQLLSEKNQPGGYVGLEANSKINPIYINNIYSNNSYVVTTLAQRNALTTATGDIVTVTDLSKIFVKLNDNPPTNTDADFAELVFPGAVLSVNGQIGVVNITIPSLLAVPANVTALDNFISSSTSVLSLNSVTSLHTTQIAALQADVAALQAATATSGLLLTYNPASAYTLNQTVKFQETSGRYNLYVANAAIAIGEIPGVDPDWLRIGDFYTIAESDALLLNKANLVGGVVPITETNPVSLIMTYVAANLAARDAITPRTTNMRVYVTANTKSYIYQPGHPLADAQGFVEEARGNVNIYTTDDTLLSDRTLTGAGFNLTFTGLHTFNVDTALTATVNDQDLTAITGTTVFNNGVFTGVTQNLFKLINNTTIVFRIKSDGGIIAGGPSSPLASYTFGYNNNNSGNFGSVVFGESSTIDINVGSGLAAGEGVWVRQYGGHAFGRNTKVSVGAGHSFIGGSFYPAETDVFTNLKVPQTGAYGAFGFYGTDATQTDNHGVNALFSAVLGGMNQNIPSTSPYSVILGGQSIKARASDPSQVYVPSLNIIIGPAAGSTGDLVLVRDGTTGLIKTVTQASIGGSGASVNIYNTDGTLTSSRILDGATFDLTFTNLTAYSIFAGITYMQMNPFGTGGVEIGGDIILRGGSVVAVGNSINLTTSFGSSGNIAIQSDGHIILNALRPGSTLIVNITDDINLNAGDDLLLNGVAGTTGQFIGNINGHALWTTPPGGGGSLTSVGLLVGTAGTNVNVTGSPLIANGDITLNIPDAGPTARGVVTTGAQTFAGNKTFSGIVAISSLVSGSVVYAAGSGQLQGDAANFYWDSGTKQLGLGTSSIITSVRITSLWSVPGLSYGIHHTNLDAGAASGAALTVVGSIGNSGTFLQTGSGFTVDAAAGVKAIQTQIKSVGAGGILLDDTTGTSGIGFTIAGALRAIFTSVGLGIGVNPPTSLLHVGASTTARASLTLDHGVAPTSPVNGDIWTTTTSMYARINGVTIDLATGGGGGGTSVFLAEYFTGNDVTTVFTIPGTGTLQITDVFVGGQHLKAGTHYTKNDAARTVTISPAVATGIGIDVNYFTDVGSVSSPPTHWDELTFGLARVATLAETLAGVADDRGITPLKLAGWWAVVGAALDVPIPPLEYACSDEASTLTTGLKLTVRAPLAFTLTQVRASLTTAQATGSLLTVDVKVNGTSVFSTLLTFDNTETSSLIAAIPPVLSFTTIANDDVITFHITQVGDGTATGLKVKLYAA